MKKPFLTPSNVLDKKHQVDSNSWFARECLNLHMEINDYINYLCGNDRMDGGAEYAGWLNSLGFQHQTDEGWWNQTAVDLDNMELFARWYKWDPETENRKLESLRDRIESIKKAKSIAGVCLQLNEKYKKVSEFI